MVVLASPVRYVVQDDGRIRWWTWITDPRDGQRRALQVVTLADGKTVHNAFFDRGFREDQG